MATSEARVKRILTRSSGFLLSVCSHSLQPYRGCAFGNSLCGVACYVQHNRWLTRGEPWGSFLEARVNAAEAYLAEHERERAWGRRRRGSFSVFCSSSTDPFVPQEARLGITRGVLDAMLAAPPDELVLQTHSPAVADHAALLVALAGRCRLRVHLSIETDRESIPGLPPPAFPVAARLEAAAALRAAGVPVVITLAPLLPIAEPARFLERLGQVADAIVLDHFIGGDGTPDGSRTLRTALPAAMEALHPGSTSLAYREELVALACRILPGRVGVHTDGFAGRLLPPPPR